MFLNPFLGVPLFSFINARTTVLFLAVPAAFMQPEPSFCPGHNEIESSRFLCECSDISNWTNGLLLEKMTLPANTLDFSEPLSPHLQKTVVIMSKTAMPFLVVVNKAESRVSHKYPVLSES